MTPKKAAEKMFRLNYAFGHWRIVIQGTGPNVFLVLGTLLTDEDRDKEDAENMLAYLREDLAPDVIEQCVAGLRKQLAERDAKIAELEAERDSWKENAEWESAYRAEGIRMARKVPELEGKLESKGLRAKIAELEDVVEKLDKTEDGVPILLKMHIWDILSDEPSEYVVAELRGTDAGREVILVNCEYRERECAGGRALYSTQEAAEAAKETS